MRNHPIGLIRDMLWILAPRTIPIFFKIVRTHPPRASLPFPKPFTASNPVGSFRNSLLHFTPSGRSGSSHHKLWGGPWLSSPRPLGRSERWFVDLREVPRVVPKSVIHDGPVGLFRNQIMIAAPSGPTQMIKVLPQRKVVRRPPQGLSGRPET